MATTAPMRAARITPVCASMAPAKPPRQPSLGVGDPRLHFGEPDLELVGRHMVAVVGRLADRGRDGVGELRVGAGVRQGAGDREGVEGGHRSLQSKLPVVDPDRAVFGGPGLESASGWSGAPATRSPRTTSGVDPPPVWGVVGR